MKNTIFILGALLIAFLAIGGAFLYAQHVPHSAAPAPGKPVPTEVQSSTVAQIVVSNTSTLDAATTTPTVGTPAATPAMITMNTSTQVTVTVQISDPRLIPGSVNVFLLGATGAQPKLVGVMQSEGNNNFSLQSVLNQSTESPIQFEVSAAFQGFLKRVLSPPLTVPVGALVPIPSSTLTLWLPGLGTPPLINNAGATSYASSAIYIGAIDPVDDQAHSLLTVVTFANASQADIRSWFEQNVDDASGTLLSSGAFQLEQLPNGLAEVNVAPIPSTYQGGPVAQGYVNASGTIYAVSQSQDAQLTGFGYPSSSVASILTAILGSVQ